MTTIRHRGVLPALALSVAGGCALSYDSDLVVASSEALYGKHGPPADIGAPAPLRDHTLDAYVRYAIHHNAELRAAFERWRAALERIPQVTALPDPMVGWAHFVEDIQTRTGPQRNRVSLSQTFPWFGKLSLRGDVAAKHAESLWARVDAVRLDVVRNVKQAWLEYAFLAKAIEIDKENVALLRELEPVVQRRVQGGAGQEELLRLQVEYSKLENELETLQKSVPALRARLDAALGRTAGPALPVPELREPETQTLDTGGLPALLAERNPELAALRWQREQNEKEVELRRLDPWPNIDIGVDYFETGSALNPGTRGSGDDPYAVRVQLNVPLWWNKYRASVREAQRSVAAASGELIDRHNSLKAGLELAVYEIDDASRQIALYKDSLLPRAQQSFEMVRASWRAGKASLLDVIDTERMLLAFAKSYWRAVKDYGKSLADLEAITGGELR